jgi:hypothetical protein
MTLWAFDRIQRFVCQSLSLGENVLIHGIFLFFFVSFLTADVQSARHFVKAIGEGIGKAQKIGPFTIDPYLEQSATDTGHRSNRFHGGPLMTFEDLASGLADDDRSCSPTISVL